MTLPRRGEVWLVDLGMAAKVRPALVISIPAEDTDRALVTLVPHTTSPRQSRFEAAVSVSFLRVGVFDAQNLVTIPHAKLIRSLGKLGGAQLASVERGAPSDAGRIAAAGGMEYLLTWNCRHIANAQIRGKIEELARLRGFEPPILCTPEELMETDQ